MSSDLVFMDTETLGLDINAPIWEFAAVRRITSGPVVDANRATGHGCDDIEKSLHLFIRHHATPWLTDFPEEFARDYHNRYSDAESVHQLEAAELIAEFMEGRPHVVGAVPNFDTERISHQLLRPNRIRDPWHYHLIDIENVVIGYLVGIGKQMVNFGELDELDMSLVAPPWKSDILSRAVDVDPDQFARHTAMGDVRWVMAQWDSVMGGAK